MWKKISSVLLTNHNLQKNLTYDCTFCILCRLDFQDSYATWKTWKSLTFGIICSRSGTTWKMFTFESDLEKSLNFKVAVLIVNRILTCHSFDVKIKDWAGKCICACTHFHRSHNVGSQVVTWFWRRAFK